MRTSIITVLVAFGLVSFSTVANAAKVDRRHKRQEERIDQGEKSGELTKGEATRLNKREDRIQEREEKMRAADGGNLTAKDKRILNREQNRASRRIFDDKHNARTAPNAIAPGEPNPATPPAPAPQTN